MAALAVTAAVPVTASAEPAPDDHRANAEIIEPTCVVPPDADVNVIKIGCGKRFPAPEAVAYL